MSIRKIQCTNGHYYDGNRYEVCPVCGAPEREENTPETVELRHKPENREIEEVADKVGVFDFWHRKKRNDDMNIPDDKTMGLGDISGTQGGSVFPVAKKIRKPKNRLM